MEQLNLFDLAKQDKINNILNKSFILRKLVANKIIKPVYKLINFIFKNQHINYLIFKFDNDPPFYEVYTPMYKWDFSNRIINYLK